MVPFEWDDRKAELNTAKHGVGFEEAVEIFSGPILTRIDRRRDYGEIRFQAMGRSLAGRLLAVTYTFRGPVVRLIFARKANHREERVFERLRAKWERRQ